MMVTFWEEYFSTLEPIGWRIALFIAVIALSWCLTGYLCMRGYLHPADSRKINHILALAGVALWFGWLPASQARGSALVAATIILIMVAISCWLRDLPVFRWFYAANTRPSDAPHERFYFWSSWLISMLGLWLTDLFFMDVNATRTAALIVGISDGLAEPVGMRYGRHRYQVWWWGAKRPALRSIEGSLCVAATSFFVVFLCLGWAEHSSIYALWANALEVALIVTVVEALSPRGWDNFTIPVAAAILLHWQANLPAS